MARNIEIKAVLTDINEGMNMAAKLSGSEAEVLVQADYFFNCDKGRLKLRFFSPECGVLIFYTRNDEHGPKMSEYYLSDTNEPQKLLQVLENSHGICGVVKKRRHLFYIGRTRIHVDMVEGLGSFLEFEVVLDPSEKEEVGIAEAHRLMEKFGVKKSDLVDCAYIDMQNQRDSDI